MAKFKFATIHESISDGIWYIFFSDDSQNMHASNHFMRSKAQTRNEAIGMADRWLKPKAGSLNERVRVMVEEDRVTKIAYKDINDERPSRKATEKKP